ETMQGPAGHTPYGKPPSEHQHGDTEQRQPQSGDPRPRHALRRRLAQGVGDPRVVARHRQRSEEQEDRADEEIEQGYRTCVHALTVSHFISCDVGDTADSVRRADDEVEGATVALLET